MAETTEQLADAGRLKRILQDDILFAERFLKIPAKPDPDTGVVSLVPMRMNRVQQHFVKNATKRNIVVKGRQMGFSTGELARNFRHIYTTPHIKGLLIAHKDDVTAMLLERVFGFHNHMPEALQHDLARDSVREIRFKEFDSGMHIETAGAGVSGRSETLAFAHLSELAHWTRNVDELIAGISEAARYGKITIESTPKGSSGKFFQLYQEAKEGENTYTPFFYPWWWDDGYQLPLDSPLALERDKRKLTYSEEETLLVNKFALTEEQIRWRRWAQSDLKELFPQEFPENDVDCWLAGENIAFNVKALRYQQFVNICPPIETDGPTRIYRLPMGGTKYVIGVDFGKGLPHGDWTVAQVLDTNRCEQVAIIRARLDSGRFAELVRPIAELYNYATIVPEVNSGFADLFLKALEDYPNLWLNPKNGRIGWLTTASTRPSMISTTAALLDGNEVIIHDATTLQEISDFRDLGSAVKVTTGHDDAAVALMIALSVYTHHPVAIKRAPVLHYR